MPTFHITSPDGHTYEVNAPEGATEEDALAHVQQSVASMPQNVQVSDPSQNWSNIGAENLQQAGIRPALTNAERLKGQLMATVPFNLGDEAAADLASTKYRFTPQEQPAYDAALSSARDVQNRYGSSHPIESTALSLPANAAATSMLPGGPLTQATIGGIIQGFGSGENGLTNRALPAVVGGATGLGTGLLLQGISKLATNPKVNPDVQLLQNEGVKLTPGQITGGIAKKSEDIATSIPIMGDLIANRQSDSIAGLNRAVANRSLGEIGQTLPDNVAAGRDTVAYVRGAMTKAYNSVLSNMQATPDMPFSAALQTAKASAAALPDAQLSQFNKIINSEIFDKVSKNSGVLDGDALKGIESTLTSEIKGYGAGDWNDQKLAGALGNVKAAFRDMLNRQNPTTAPALAATDRAYANYAILRKAGSAVGNDNGVFTPAQLLSAVKGADSSAGNGNFASGTSRMQDLADAAKNVLPSKFPDSGTARRLMTGSALAPAAYLSGQAIPAAGAVGLGSLAYTTAGQKLLSALLTGQRPGAISAIGQGINNLSPALSSIPPLLLTHH